MPPRCVIDAAPAATVEPYPTAATTPARPPVAIIAAAAKAPVAAPTTIPKAPPLAPLNVILVFLF